MITFGGLHAFVVSQEISKTDPPFAALLFAAMRKADTMNMMRLRLAFPDLCEEMERRYNAPGGRLEEDR